MGLPDYRQVLLGRLYLMVSDEQSLIVIMDKCHFDSSSALGAIFGNRKVMVS
jgi:hypothetical protein